MKNHISDTKSSEVMFKSFKLPILQVSKPQFCNKVLHDFKKCLEENKQSYRGNFQPKAEQIIKKLKLASLIKGDRKSLSTIPVSSECYYPYRRISRVVQTDFRKMNIKKRSMEVMRNNTEGKDNIMVSKASMHINLHQQNKINYDFKNHLQTPRKLKNHKRSSTEGVYNFIPFSDRSTNHKILKTERVQTLDDLNTFLTGTNMDMNYRQTNKQQKKEGFILKTYGKSKLKNKLDKLEKHNNNSKQIMNGSLRGWTQYGNKKQYMLENNEDI